MVLKFVIPGSAIETDSEQKKKKKEKTVLSLNSSAKGRRWQSSAPEAIRQVK